MTINREPSDLDDAQLAVWRGFLEAHSMVTRKLERDLMEQAGVPLTWYDVLVHLSEAPRGRLRHQVLADSLLFSAGLQLYWLPMLSATCVSCARMRRARWPRSILV